jgi:hypothetical protein
MLPFCCAALFVDAASSGAASLFASGRFVLAHQQSHEIPPQERANTAAHLYDELAEAFAANEGGITDGIAGAKRGAAIGRFLGGPFGAFIGGLAGAIGGYFGGDELAQAAITWVVNQFGWLRNAARTVGDWIRGQ